jgi:hypothetical protein
VRCHLGVAPQERTAEEHTTRGPCTTLATSGRGILGGMVSRGWSLSTVLCEDGTYPAPTSMTNGSRRKSSTSCSRELMDADRMIAAQRPTGSHKQGRHTTGPLIERYLARLIREGLIHIDDPAEAFCLFYGLTIRTVRSEPYLENRHQTPPYAPGWLCRR